jgi:hypothetical protein
MLKGLITAEMIGMDEAIGTDRVQLGRCPVKVLDLKASLFLQVPLATSEQVPS